MVCTYNFILHLFAKKVENELKMLGSSNARTNNKRSHQKKVVKTPDYVTLDIPPDNKLIFEEAVQEFDLKCQSLSHFCCQSCQMTGITMRPSHKMDFYA